MKVTMTMTMLLVCILGLSVWGVQAYPSGAPSTACQTMLPGHRNSGAPIFAQNAGGGGVPFTVTTSKTTYAPGDTITVTVTGLSQQFSAFIIQARRTDPSLNQVEPVGKFTVFSGAQAVCNQPTGAFGLTHTFTGQQTNRTVQQFNWIAPGSAQGHIKFRMTLAASKYTFWTDVESVEVSDGTSPDTATPANTVMQPIRQINTVNECGLVKGCYLHPAGCVESNCEFLLTYRGNGEFVDFEMSAATTGYVAVGFSNDDKMGADSVIECVFDKDKNRVVIKHSYNQNAGSNIQVDNPTIGLYNMTGYYHDGRLSCRFRRRRMVSNAVNVYDLDKNYYLLLARGAASGSGLKYQHDLSSGSLVSPDKVDPSAVSSVSGSKRYPIAKAHGIMMVLAWVFCASFGMLLARYYKPMWASQRLCDERVWFQVHRSLMISVMILTILAIVLIFIMVGGYSYGLRDLPGKAHPILGLIIMCLVIINPLITICRPHPDDENRPIFNWFHWAIGTIAHVLSIPTMFIGLSLPKAHTSPVASWILIVFVIVHCVIEISLEIHQCCTHKRNKEKREEYDVDRMKSPRDYNREPEPSGRFFKMFMLATHGVLVGACAIVIILLIALG